MTLGCGHGAMQLAWRSYCAMTAAHNSTTTSRLKSMTTSPRAQCRCQQERGNKGIDTPLHATSTDMASCDNVDACHLYLLHATSTESEKVWCRWPVVPPRTRDVGRCRRKSTSAPPWRVIIPAASLNTNGEKEAREWKGRRGQSRHFACGCTDMLMWHATMAHHVRPRTILDPKQ